MSKPARTQPHNFAVNWDDPNPHTHSLSPFKREGKKSSGKTPHSARSTNLSLKSMKKTG